MEPDQMTHQRMDVDESDTWLTLHSRPNIRHSKYQNQNGIQASANGLDLMAGMGPNWNTHQGTNANGLEDPQQVWT